MSLQNINFPNYLDTSNSDLNEDFFIPALSKSVRYDRGVGYFSSGWLKLAAKGMALFAENGGYARWVTSPILDKRDWEALVAGDEARRNTTLKNLLEKNIEDLTESLEMKTLSALAWMVADGIIDFRIALPVNKLSQGDFHDKFGVFTDQKGDQVSFNGSYNDSIQGTRNYESIKIFCSWKPALMPFMEPDVKRFERLWSNEDPNVRIYNLPESAKEKLIRFREYSRPYTHIPTTELEINMKPPSLPIWLNLRDYQKEAIAEWKANNWTGLLEMATGTGKTITSLAASIKLLEEENRLALIIVCPYQHLVDQWFDEAKHFGYLPIRAYKSRNTWLAKLREKINFYNHKDIDYLCVITTHATFSTEHFQKAIEEIAPPKLLIADEVHHLGSSNRRDFLPSSFSKRLALSATPDRWFDDEGTQILRDYFGKTVFELSLADAIGLSLTQYYYYPTLVELDDEEMEEYKILSIKIGQMMAQNKDDSD